MRGEQVTDAIAFHGEGPVWSARWGGLRWVDMLAGDVLSLRADGSVGRRHVGSIAAALRPRTRGGAVIGVERGFALEAPDGAIAVLDELWESTGVRMNEGACDPDGRFYCGSMAYDRTPGAGALFRLDADRSAQRVLDDVTISNGLDWSPDGARAYYTDTETHQVDVFDYEFEHGLTNRRALVYVAPGDGRPDGLTVDAAGGVWVAHNHTGSVRRYATDGRLDAIVEIPPRQVTACTFGGPELDLLFITTSREGLAPDDDPLAGALFCAQVGIRGMPVREFRG